ncbi:MAG: hydroxymethylbilane synthase [Planctomycetota bacterium]|nr:hydroxymethylbilane synthase [Planctomycetota bacterium]
MKIVLGTRGSSLARTQTGTIADLLRANGHDVELQIIETRGDLELAVTVPELGGKGLFTAELEEAILSGRVDAAVHSLKDLPTQDADGLVLAAIPRREDPRDALVARKGEKLADLPQGARVGTASLRRKALLLHARPDLDVVPMRGNVDTRLAKVDGGEVEAIVVAAAGLKRLRRAGTISELLDFLPAPAQGALAVQARADRDEVIEALGRLHDAGTATCVQAERSLLHELEGGCSVPVGALAKARGDQIELHALVASLDGSRVLKSDARGADPIELGRGVARRLRAQGAQEILDALA